MLHDFLTENCFVQNLADYCAYSKQIDKERVILIIWVDDLIIAANNDQILKSVKEMLVAKFKMKDLGKRRHFLGIDFTQTNGVIKMNQKRYITKILERFDMTRCKPRSTPCEMKMKFDNDGEPADPKRYRAVVGSLIYVMTSTCPDFSFIVSKLSQYLSVPKDQHWVAAKNVLSYLKGTVDLELCYKKNDVNLKLVAYSDADLAADLIDWRSVTGCCFSLCASGSIISWKSKKQQTVALSTCEAECMAFSATTTFSQVTVWRSQLSVLKTDAKS